MPVNLCNWLIRKFLLKQVQENQRVIGCPFSSSLLVFQVKPGFHAFMQNPNNIDRLLTNPFCNYYSYLYIHITIFHGREAFFMPGCRIEGGFVGDHDRTTGMPIPVHISTRAEDLESLLNGLMETYKILSDSDFNPVLMVTIVAFGFVFIHPFEDGNGRIHRYLFHHVLAEKGFVSKGLVFPISAVIMQRIDDYRETLEHYSKLRLELIDWRPNEKNNVEVLNDTADLYRYFDATRQAEFLFECVEETVNKTLPEEVDYLTKYDLLNEFIKNYIDMPDKLVNLLIRLLGQNNGKLSNRARDKEFNQLTDAEIQAIEQKYEDVFTSD